MVTILKSLTGKNKDDQHGRTKHGNRGMGFLNQRAELGDQGSRGRQCSETEAGGQAGSLRDICQQMHGLQSLEPVLTKAWQDPVL